MGVGHVQHTRIAEAADVVEIVGFGGTADAGSRQTSPQP
jgi:hypothetical protein